MGAERSRRVAATCCAALVVVGLPAGCGGGSPSKSSAGKAVYERRMQAISARFTPAETHALLPVVRALRRRALARAAAELRRASRLYAAEAEALAAIVPPAEIARDHAVLVAVARAVARHDLATSRSLTVSEAQRGGTFPNPPTFDGASWVRRTEAAANDLRSKGYDVGDFTGGAEHVAP